MKYLLMIYTNEVEDAVAPPAEQQQVMAEYWAFNIYRIRILDRMTK